MFRGQRPDGQQPIKETSLKIYPLLLYNVSSLIRDRNISIEEATEFQSASHNKIRWNYIFEATNCKRIILIFSLLEVRQ